MTSRDIDDLARQVVGWANENEHVEAYVGCSRDIDVVVHGSEVESLSSAEIGGVGIRVVRDGKQGFAFAGSFDETVLRETLIDARDNASFATYDEFGGLAEPDGVEPADLDLWRPQLTATSTDRKVDLALELEKLTMCGDARVRSVRSASYGDSMTESAIASTDGIDVSSRRSTCYIVANAIAGSADDTQTGTGYSVGRSVDDLDVQQAADDAAQRATRLLGATQPASSRVSVIFDPTVTPALLGILASTLNGELVLKGRSLFAGRIGETVASSSVTLLDDPTVAEAFGAARYDSEGLACRRNVLIDNGVLQGFLYNSYAARRAGARSTGSAVRAGYKSTPGVGSRAIVLSPGMSTPEELAAELGNGILVQAVSGVHSGVNPVSGDFSVGVEGLRIVDGQLGEPIREATIASTLQRMLQDVVGIGNDLTWLPGGAAGVSLAVEGVSLSGR